MSPIQKDDPFIKEFHPFVNHELVRENDLDQTWKMNHQKKSLRAPVLLSWLRNTLASLLWVSDLAPPCGLLLLLQSHFS